ncbi:protein phosphatase 2C domain-containing protein [Deinococcus xinjiangensis]
MEKKDLLWFGASVAGPAHQEANMPCQDAWAVGRWLDDERQPVVCGVVCDGLGSRPLARQGALAGIRAAKAAARQWARAPDAPVSLLVRLLEVLWRLEVAPAPAVDCATTCLILLVLPGSEERRVVGCVLGDGLAVVETIDGIKTLGGRLPGLFSNETLALGTVHHMNDWQILDLKTPGQLRVLLLSDGIADDVPTEHVASFLSWGNEFETRSPKGRGRALRRALERWPVPGHTDDKTLVYMRLEGMGQQ